MNVSAKILAQTTDLDTPILVFCPDILRRNISELRKYPVEISFAVKSNYSRTILDEIAPLVDSFDVQTSWEASLVPNDSNLRFHSPLLDKQIFSKKKLQQVTVNSIEQANELARHAPDLRWGCRITLPAVEAGQFIAKSEKFGIEEDRLADVLLDALRAGRPCRYVHHHSASRLSNPEIAGRLSQELSALLKRLPREVTAAMDAVCIGGGLDGAGELRARGCSVGELMSALLAPIQSQFEGLRVVIEPGRYIVEDACFVVTSVAEVREGAAELVAVVDIGSGFLVPLPAARFRLAGESSGEGRPVVLVDASCSPNGIILRADTSISITAGSRLVIENCGAYTISCSGPYLHQLPHLWVLDGMSWRCATSLSYLEKACREILY
jgi:diaminopimelate decarboxylase